MTAVEQMLRPQPKRDRFGRYLVKGKPYTRATTIAGTIEDRYNLELWKIRMTAVGLTNRPDLYAQVAGNHDDKKKLNAICEDALEAAKGTAGANLGSALHTFTERVDLGETINIPPPWDVDVAAYRAAMDAGGVTIEPDGIEQIVVLHDIQVAGTFDRLVRIAGHDLPLIADLKTGAGLDFSWGSIAIQLALYAHADEVYDPATDTTRPMQPVDQGRALVMHLPAGQATCTLHMVDIAAGWEAAQLCMAARDWRKRKDLASPVTSFATPVAVEPAPVPGPVSEPAPVDRVEWLNARLFTLRLRHPDAFTELASRWPVGVPTLKQGGLDADQLQTVIDVVTQVEARHDVPFGPPDPLNLAPSAEVVATLTARLEALPAEVLEVVKAQAKELKVPNVKGRKFTAAHVPVVMSLLDDAERAVQSTTPAEDAA